MDKKTLTIIPDNLLLELQYERIDSVDNLTIGKIFSDEKIINDGLLIRINYHNSSIKFPEILEKQGHVREEVFVLSLINYKDGIKKLEMGTLERFRDFFPNLKALQIQGLSLLPEQNDYITEMNLSMLILADVYNIDLKKLSCSSINTLMISRSTYDQYYTDVGDCRSIIGLDSRSN